MCGQAPAGNQSRGRRPAIGSAGARLDRAQRATSATGRGGTVKRGVANTVLSGAPRNSGVDALRKTTSIGV
jgi:uracil-DNA glycosylase